MLKIPCMISRFMTKWSFHAKVFCSPGSKNVLSYYSYRTGFLKQLKKIVNANKRTSSTMPFRYIKLKAKIFMK